MIVTQGPWKVVVAGTQWGISRAKAARGEGDICMGSTYHEDWRANSKAIAALPDLIPAAEDALEALVADIPEATVAQRVKALRAALMKAR